MKKIDYNKAIEIGENIYWIGMYFENDVFQCHPYLIKNGDESVLIDPGSMLEFEAVVKKITEVDNMKNIKYIVLDHQDPDLAASISEIEKLIDREDLQIITHSRMIDVIKHYGITSSYYRIDKNNYELKTKNGLKLKFLTTPYCHSPGAFVSYEPKSKILFSGDIFGGIEESWKFYADENYFEEAKVFHREYMPSRDIFNYSLNKIEKLDMELIAPQHGSIIKKKYITKLIDDLKKLDCGLYVREVYSKNLLDTIEELKKAKLNSELVIESNPNAIIAVNSQKEIYIFNQNAQKMFGYTNKEMLDLDSLIKIIPPENLDFYYKRLKKFLKTGNTKGINYSSIEQIGIRKDGERFPLRISFGTHTSLKERIVIANIEDISKEKNREKFIQHQSKLAQMGEMMTMIAHQWRQPLNAISTTSINLNLKAKLGKLNNSYVIEHTDKICTFSRHLSTTINDFRDFFKADKKKKKICLCNIIKSVLDIIEVPIINQNIRLIQDLKSKTKINTYPNELKQVILNLIKNSEDIVLEKKIFNPYIKISTYQKENNHILEVSDNGGGVPTKLIDKIFEPDFSTKIDKDGTGLGLYMSKTIIEEHCGGKLSIKNGKDGAIFKIVLPINLKDSR